MSRASSLRFICKRTAGHRAKRYAGALPRHGLPGGQARPHTLVAEHGRPLACLAAGAAGARLLRCPWRFRFLLVGAHGRALACVGCWCGWKTAALGVEGLGLGRPPQVAPQCTHVSMPCTIVGYYQHVPAPSCEPCSTCPYYLAWAGLVKGFHAACASVASACHRRAGQGSGDVCLRRGRDRLRAGPNAAHGASQHTPVRPLSAKNCCSVTVQRCSAWHD